MIFTKGSSTLTVTAIYPVTIDYNPHQNRGVSENDTVRVYNRGDHGEIITIPLRIKDNELTNLRTWIKNTILFSYHQFYVTPDSGHDIGNGDGGSVLVRWWDDTFTETRSNYGLQRATLVVKRADVNPWGAGDYADDIDMPEELDWNL